MKRDDPSATPQGENAASVANFLPQDCASDPHAACKATGQVLDLIADKWTIMTVGALSKGPMRFNEIMRTINGVSHRMLTLTLRGLESNGIVTRTAYATIPPRVEYELTDLGGSLIAPLRVLSSWAITNRPNLEQARAVYEARKLGE